MKFNIEHYYKFIKNIKHIFTHIELYTRRALRPTQTTRAVCPAEHPASLAGTAGICTQPQTKTTQIKIK